ncbi:hypothetical protein SNEBB_000598 [Seison nebaliae]|nr:hypothetical protein SNEBB_000598 [Seison nebaliae]
MLQKEDFVEVPKHESDGGEGHPNEMVNIEISKKKRRKRRKNKNDDTELPSESGYQSRVDDESLRRMENNSSKNSPNSKNEKYVVGRAVERKNCTIERGFETKLESWEKEYNRKLKTSIRKQNINCILIVLLSVAFIVLLSFCVVILLTVDRKNDQDTDLKTVNEHGIKNGDHLTIINRMKTNKIPIFPTHNPSSLLNHLKIQPEKINKTIHNKMDKKKTIANVTMSERSTLRPSYILPNLKATKKKLLKRKDSYIFY